MEYLTFRGLKLDLAALEEYLRTSGPEAGESAAERAELLEQVRELRGARAYERKKWRITPARAGKGKARAGKGAFLRRR